MGKRRRGTAIVEREEGILLTAMKDGVFVLPGGGAEEDESRFRAAIRELEEETYLQAHSAKILFRHESYHHQHTVVYIEARGVPKPRNEVQTIAYYKPGKKLKLSQGTVDILAKYLQQES